jgi:hypothetical protein
MSIGSGEALDTRALLNGGGGMASLPVAMGQPSPRMQTPQRPEALYGSMAGGAVSHGFGMGSMPVGSLKMVSIGAVVCLPGGTPRVALPLKSCKRE